MIVRAALLVVCMVSVTAVAEAQPARTFSVTQAKRAFYSQTGFRLVNYQAASTPDARSLRTTPYRTSRFGTFQLFVLNPRKLQRMRRVFTHGVQTRPPRHPLGARTAPAAGSQ